MQRQTEKPLSELRSIRDMVLWGAQQFEHAELCHTHGMPDALDEAVFLCLSALHRPLDIEQHEFDTVLSDDEKQQVLAAYNRRIEQRIPASYITQSAWFAGLEFYVDERVLIPRSPFAELIDDRFAPWIAEHRVHDVLDLCTGSGCIAIACASAFPDARVVATDLSADALDVAEINRQRHGLQDRLQLLKSDLFDAIPAQQFDLIVSNPPYVSLEEMSELNAEFDHEPALGLAAGEQGLDIVIPMLRQARDYLKDDGILVVEVGYTWPVLQQALPGVPFMWLEFEFGGEGVFTLTAEQLQQCQSQFDSFQL